MRRRGLVSRSGGGGGKGTEGRRGVGWRFYAEIKVRIEWRLVQMHTDVKVVRGYLVKKSGGKLLRCSRVKQDKEEDILINICTGCLRNIGRREIRITSFLSRCW